MFLAAANYADRGSKVLLRDRHWGPYDGFLAGCGLGIATYPLLNEAQGLGTRLKDSLTNLAKSQSKVMSWLNDPAHNPTGLSLTASERMGVLAPSQMSQ